MIREGARGITRLARPKGGRTGIRAKGRLGLDGQGCKPQSKGKKCQPFTAGRRPHKGWKPRGRDYRLGSRQPGPMGAPK